jgi:DNA polymerase II small subunit
MTGRKDDELVVVRRMLELGYQVDLDAVGQLLNQEGGPAAVLHILELVVQTKGQKHSKNFVISLRDVKSFLRAESVLNSTIEVAVSDFEVVFDPTGAIGPTSDTSGYVSMFRDRLDKMASLIRGRPDFFQIEKLNAIKTPSSGRKVLAKVVGLVVSKKAAGDYVSLTLEDDSGYLRLMCTDDAARKAEEVLLDEFILAEVESLPRGYYARSIFHPDIPDRAKHVADKRVYALFVSDLHIGGPGFDEAAFSRMVSWLNGDFGELEVVSRVGYVILNGDLIENPLSRDGRLNDRDVESSYDLLAGYLSSIRKPVRIFIVPGETDATRNALPQPAIIRKYAKKLYEMRNVCMLGNPSIVKLHGVSVLLYHGQGLDDVFRQLQATSVGRPTTGMRTLLKARHMAPSYGGVTSLAPERRDLLIIDLVPDIMHCGHVGVPDEDMYRGTLLLSTPSWDPRSASGGGGQGKAALVDLSTFEVLWRP